MSMDCDITNPIMHMESCSNSLMNCSTDQSSCCDEIDWVGQLLSGSNSNLSLEMEKKAITESCELVGKVKNNYDNINKEKGKMVMKMKMGNKTSRSRSSSSSSSSSMPRIAFQTKSAEDVLDDGYRWRKYGQKAVKHTTHPRSYYRCTHHTCNVKKQIQRHSKDPTIVVTTYEGIHNHPSEKLMETLTPLLKQLQFLSGI